MFWEERFVCGQSLWTLLALHHEYGKWAWFSGSWLSRITLESGNKFC